MVGENQHVPRDSNAYRYIKYGENLEVDVTRGSQRGRRKLPQLETIRARSPWYSLPSQPLPSILFPYMINVRARAFLNLARAHAVDVMHYIVLNSQTSAEILCAYLNSSIFALMSELYGRSYGGGVLKIQVYELKQIPVIESNLLSSNERRTLTYSFNSLEETIRERMKIEKEYDRLKSRSKSSRGSFSREFEQRLEDAKKRLQQAQKELDEAIYDILGLTVEERRQVEEGLRELQELRRKRTKP
jgi:hypothetical protein